MFPTRHKNMIKFYTNLLTPEDCKEIADEMYSYFQRGNLQHETGEDNLNSFGFYNLPSTMVKTSKIEQVIKKDFGKNIVFENNYTRIYLNGSTMGCHVDRERLDITLSVNVYSDLNFLYPLKISKKELIHKNLDWNLNEDTLKYYKEDYFNGICLPGEGVATLARKFPHWREPLICANDEMLIQTFFHWKYIEF